VVSWGYQMPDFQLTRDKASRIPISTDHEISRVTCPTCGGQGQIMPANPWEGPTPTERAELERWIQDQQPSSSKKLAVRTKQNSLLKLAKHHLVVIRLREKLQTTARTLFGGGSVYPRALQCLGAYGKDLGILTSYQQGLIIWLQQKPRHNPNDPSMVPYLQGAACDGDGSPQVPGGSPTAPATAEGLPGHGILANGHLGLGLLPGGE
jgi:hypothetical protein